MINEAMIQLISDQLFAESGVDVYAIFDGASVPNLLNMLANDKIEHCCLFSGNLEPDHADAAPYLAKMEQSSRFLKSTLENGWGNHWGIFVGVPSGIELRQLRKHFRTFLMVRSFDGKPLYFRYYDPRVFRVYLPTCNQEEMKHVFGPVGFYAMEADDGQMLLQIRPDKYKPRVEEVRFGEAVA